MFCADCTTSTATTGTDAFFLGEEALMLHIEASHMGDGKWPTGDVLKRMGCVIGFKGAETEWDIWLPDHYRDGSAESALSVGEGRRVIRRKPLRVSVA